ncbi:MAG: hypothetical protein M1834_004563 [Cirrosporium novae-zelandiae]|nr:MAG: hypothetical protein M1834_004563 [Cirrosporium novae-zelandiae]
MASIQSKRRPALIPSAASLSEEDTRDIIWNRTGFPPVPPPDTAKCHLRIAAEIATEHQEGVTSDYNSSRQVYDGSKVCYSAGDLPYTIRRKSTTSSGSCGSEDLNRSDVDVRHENKRNRSAFSEQEHLSYFPEMEFDIPHVSEIDRFGNDHEITALNGVFESTSQNSPFQKVRSPHRVSRDLVLIEAPSSLEEPLAHISRFPYLDLATIQKFLLFVESRLETPLIYQYGAADWFQNNCNSSKRKLFSVLVY